MDILQNVAQVRGKKRFLLDGFYDNFWVSFYHNSLKTKLSGKQKSFSRCHHIPCLYRSR